MMQLNAVFCTRPFLWNRSCKKRDNRPLTIITHVFTKDISEQCWSLFNTWSYRFLSSASLCKDLGLENLVNSSKCTRRALKWNNITSTNFHSLVIQIRFFFSEGRKTLNFSDRVLISGLLIVLCYKNKKSKLKKLIKGKTNKKCPHGTKDLTGHIAWGKIVNFCWLNNKLFSRYTLEITT